MQRLRSKTEAALHTAVAYHFSSSSDGHEQSRGPSGADGSCIVSELAEKGLVESKYAGNDGILALGCEVLSVYHGVAVEQYGSVGIWLSLCTTHSHFSG